MVFSYFCVVNLKVMSTVILIYLVVAFCVVLLPMLFKFSLTAVVYMLILPAVPFLVAYENWSAKPVQSRLIVALYGLLYLIILLMCLLF